MIERGLNSPEKSSMGRLFDAVSSLVGLRNSVSYEGQAAIELEAIAEGDDPRGYEFERNGGGTIRTEPVIRAVVEDLLDGMPPGAISRRFHQGVAEMIVSVARGIRDERHLDRVVLSGGVFQNMLLLNLTRTKLVSEGFEVFTHSRVPPNDGGISLGQAAVANARFAAGRV
jgi:hydrogenase maturation protein HypF